MVSPSACLPAEPSCIVPRCFAFLLLCQCISLSQYLALFPRRSISCCYADDLWPQRAPRRPVLQVSRSTLLAFVACSMVLLSVRQFTSEPVPVAADFSTSTPGLRVAAAGVPAAEVGNVNPRPPPLLLTAASLNLPPGTRVAADATAAPQVCGLIIHVVHSAARGPMSHCLTADDLRATDSCCCRCRRCRAGYVECRWRGTG